jgi:moderate conductance mechanosensitive channel
MSPRIYPGLMVLLEEAVALIVLALITVGVLGWLARRVAHLPLLRRYPDQIAAVAIEIIGIFFLSRLILAVFNLVMDRMFLVRRDHNDYQWQQRLTLVPLIKSVCKYIIFFTAVLLSLSAWGVNTTPVLAALGGAGIVVGLGAQPVINDLVSGLFILFENVYLVGDYVEIGTARGIVEGIDIRTTRVRGDPGGEIYVIRNGQINNVNSYSKGYVYAIVNVGVDYGEDRGRSPAGCSRPW